MFKKRKLQVESMAQFKVLCQEFKTLRSEPEKNRKRLLEMRKELIEMCHKLFEAEKKTNFLLSLYKDLSSTYERCDMLSQEIFYLFYPEVETAILALTEKKESRRNYSSEEEY